MDDMDWDPADDPFNFNDRDLIWICKKNHVIREIFVNICRQQLSLKNKSLFKIVFLRILIHFPLYNTISHFSKKLSHNNIANLASDATVDPIEENRSVHFWAGGHFLCTSL